MPVYEYLCSQCKKRFDQFKKLAEYKEPAIHENCGGMGSRVISKPMIAVDYPAYISPASGKLIEGKKAHLEDLKATGCRILEPGERADKQKQQLDNERKFDKMLDNSLGEILAQTKSTTGDLHG